MIWSILDIAEARRIVEALLEALPLEKYAFSLEPTNGDWDIQIEYAGPEGWQVKTVRIDDQNLRGGREQHSATFQRLVDAWHDQLLGASGR